MPKDDHHTKFPTFFKGRRCDVSKRKSKNKDFIKDKIKKFDSEPTDAYGKIYFGGNARNHAKYVKVGHETKPEIIYKLLTKHWVLKPPNLIISVTGGAKNFNLPRRLEKVFRKYLIKASESTGAWITSGGTHAGVMKHVGMAVKEHAAVRADVVTIGIATWGVIHGNEKLINNGSNVCKPKVYNAEVSSQGENVILDHNHSHYILVDDGTSGKYGGEIKLRTDFESFLSEKETHDKVKVMVVCVLLQGGPGSLKTVAESIEKGTPVVIVAGSGGCADLLASVHAMDSVSVEKVGKLIKEKELDPDKVSIEEWTKQVNTCLSNKNLMSVFELDPTDETKDLDIAILNALLQAGKETEKIKQQLRLAMAWNRSDIIKSQILKDDACVKREDIAEMFFLALKNNKHKFCKVFLDYDVDLKEYCTEEKLLDLYNAAPEESFVNKKMKKEFSIKDIGRIMVDLLGPSYINVYGERQPAKGNCSITEESKIDDPLMELFQWAILVNYREIAMHIWEYMFQSMPAAIMATKMLKAIAKRQCHGHEKEMKILEDAKVYEKKAIGILNECFTSDHNKTALLLLDRLNKWGGYTCLHAAAEADDKVFISRSGVQYVFDVIWMGKLDINTPSCLLLLFGICPLLISKTIKFNKFYCEDPKDTAGSVEDCESGKSAEERSKYKPYSIWQKVVFFYDAPAVKFWMNVLAFLGYLFLFAFVILGAFDINTVSVSICEYVLLGWITTFLLEELRELIDQEASSLLEKFKLYIFDAWNIMDLASLTLFYVGFGLRWDEQLLEESLILYSVAFLIHCISIVHIFGVHEILGPKIIMVGKMLQDLLFFLFILVVFLLAYGIASQALLYPGETNVHEIIVGILNRPYWEIYGEIFLDEIKYNPNVDALTCSNSANDNLPRCPQESKIVPIMTALYLLFANVLLLNLLIAMFSHTFEKVENQSYEIWKFQRYYLIKYYYRRPPLVPPLIVLSHIYRCYKFWKKVFQNPEKNSSFHCVLEVDLGERESRKLWEWEHWHAEAFIRDENAENDNKVERRLEKLSNRMDVNTSTIQDIRSKLFPETQKRKSTDGLKVKPYPNSNKYRCYVPDDKIKWETEWSDYKPASHTDPVLKPQPPWADNDLESFAVEDRPVLPYNEYDQAKKVDRRSHLGKYKVVNGIPLNPRGRTGLTGRGLLGRYGPNHAADPVVTRWKRNDKKDIIKIHEKPVLEFVAVKRADTGEWAIPGGMVDPGEHVSATLKREFCEEALNIDGVDDRIEIEKIKEKVQTIFKSGGKEILQLYCDDHRNTDNAWVETTAYNFHDEDGTAFMYINLSPGDEVKKVSWKQVDGNLKLFASHREILKKTAEMHDAYF